MVCFGSSGLERLGGECPGAALFGRNVWVRQVTARHGWDWNGRYGPVRFGEAWRVVVRQARLGLTWLGLNGFGEARQERLGKARNGPARLVTAWTVWQARCG